MNGLVAAGTILRSVHVFRIVSAANRGRGQQKKETIQIIQDQHEVLMSYLITSMRLIITG